MICFDSHSFERGEKCASMQNFQTGCSPMHSGSSKTLPRIQEFELQVEQNSGRSRSFQDPNGPFTTNSPVVLRQRENCMLQVPKILIIPVELALQALLPSCERKSCNNCILVIAGSPKFNPGSRNQSPNLPSGTTKRSEF